MSDAGPLSLPVRLAAVAHEVATPIALAAQACEEICAQAGEALARASARSAAGNDPQAEADARDLAQIVGSAQAVRANLERAERLLSSYRRTAAAEAAPGARLTFPVLAVLRDALDTVAPLLRKSRIGVHLRGDESVEVTGDPGALAQAALNLVVNAIRHGYGGQPAPGARIEVSVARAGERAAEVAVRDFGAGIAPALLPRIFEPLVTTDGASGSGLGLAIVRDLVETRFGGTIAAESEPGRGARFVIRLPLR